MDLMRAPLTLGALLVLASGCDTGEAAQPGRTLEGPFSSSGQGEAGTAGMRGGQGDAAISSGLPCEIDVIVRGRCQGCHSDPPQSGAPMPLVTRANLVAMAKSDATKIVAQLAFDRTTSATSPMPPSGPRVPDAETAALSAWIKAGFPAGTCGDPAGVVDAGPNPFNTPPMCTSGTYWTDGDKKDPRMHPGGACLTCHAQNPDAPTLLAGGTVFPSAHEPNDCNGVDGAGYSVQLIDADGKTYVHRVNAAGNFFHSASDGPFRTPFHAKVINLQTGAERAMGHAEPSGDCNSCHTQAGTNGAPGRILAP